MKCIIALIVFTLYGTGCEGITDGDGYVYDAKTKKPIDSVLARSYSKTGRNKRFESEMITDYSGYFYGSTGLNGCVGNCPDLVVELIKNGYTLKEVVNPFRDTVYIE